MKTLVSLDILHFLTFAHYTSQRIHHRLYICLDLQVKREKGKTYPGCGVKSDLVKDVPGEVMPFLDLLADGCKHSLKDVMRIRRFTLRIFYVPVCFGCPIFSLQPEHGSRVSFRNVVCIRYTSENGECPMKGRYTESAIVTSP
jgi:hypothetical protein